jgi:hypothetical protein
MNAGSKSVRRFAANNGEKYHCSSISLQPQLTITTSIPLTRQHMYILPEPPLTPSAPIRFRCRRTPRVSTINTSTTHRAHHRQRIHTKSLPHPGLARCLPPTSHHPRSHELRASILPVSEAPKRASCSPFQQILLLQEGHARRC